jgi:hypothetical protein
MWMNLLCIENLPDHPPAAHLRLQPQEERRLQILLLNLPPHRHHHLRRPAPTQP